jgi:hypothetical protein
MFDIRTPSNVTILPNLELIKLENQGYILRKLILESTWSVLENVPDKTKTIKSTAQLPLVPPVC